MNDFNSMKNDLLQVNNEILSLFQKARTIPGMSRFPFDGWEKVGHTIGDQIHEDILRVAVVGAIKSGKSTFVNAFLGGDYLKRGAGVVTSIVTRIRKSPRLKAILDFKTWDEVNADMQQAMVLFPSLDWNSGDGHFDIRREEDRRDLEKALHSLSAEKLVSQETLDVNGVMLTSYLKGYERVKEILSRARGIHLYEDHDFFKHKDYVGDDSLAVYLKDLELRIPGGENLGDNIEIADCQGIDSLNPLHLAMIQDYLLRAHLIVYILSSRTGIRQADMRFLSIIKKMGLMENIFFVVNCDFNEHENIDDLKAVVERIKEEISVMRPGPRVFTFSTLFHLLDELNDDISRRDRMRMEQWEKEVEFARYSEKEREKFLSVLLEKLKRDKSTLLLKNHLERAGIIAAGLNDWTKINYDILMKDAKGAREILKKIERAREKLNQQKSLIKDTLDGTSHKIRRELGKDVDRFLDARYGDLSRDIHEFVKKHRVDYHKNETDIEELGFSTTLYMIFQDFKRALDRYMAEIVNPRLIQFIREEEGRIIDILDKTADSYDALVRDVLQRHEETLKNLGISSRSYSPGEIHYADMEGLKRRVSLSAPPLVSTLRYTAKIRTEAIMRRGFYNFVKVLKKILKKPIRNQQEGEIFALQDGMKRIKQETALSINFHLKDYKENLKFQYLYKLVDMVSENLHEALLDRFNIFTADMSEMAGLVDTEESEKKDAVEILKYLREGSGKALDKIVSLRAEIGN
jgi:hypothetical protein